MISCQKCGAQYESQFKHERVCVPKETKLTRLDSEIKEHLEKYGEIQSVAGAFGENNSLGYIERQDKEGIKFYGCSYIFRVNPDSKLVDSAAATKATYIGVIRLAFKNPFILLRPRPLVEFLARAYEVDLKKKVSYEFSGERHPIKFDQLPSVCQEIVRAGKEIGKLYPLKFKQLKDEFGETLPSAEYRYKIEEVFEALAAFVWIDGAYYFRALDFFSNIRKGTLRAFNMVIERERDPQVVPKMKMIRFVIKAALLFPKTRKMIKILETIRVFPDNNDTYFAYRRKAYDFNGKSYEDRMKWVKHQDEAKQNTIIE
jgi:hypothetical protein